MTRRRILIGTGIYLALTLLYALVSWDRLLAHSPFNHFVYLADAWLNGQLHLPNAPPNANDWARYEGRWYVSFPPFPAILMLPGVALFGLAFNDRLLTVLLAGLGPALAFFVLEKLRDLGRSERSTRENLVLTALIALGSVYFFSAVQGTVWYTAHVVGAALVALYVLFALDARHPVLAGLMLGLGFLTRTPLLFAFPLFLFELWRTRGDPPAWKPVVRTLVLFGVPVVAVGLAAMAYNWVRFDDPFVFGHEHLTVGWSSRIRRWGLFNYHFLGRNLSVALTLLPWLSREFPYLQISNHGLALWVTTPVFLYLLWPRQRGELHRTLWLTVAATAAPSLLYQNDGWVQFGYRFSNDYALFLVMLLAIGARPLTKWFHALVIVAVLVNLFGAVTFDRQFIRTADDGTSQAFSFYDPDMTARNVFQPD